MGGYDQTTDTEQTDAAAVGALAKDDPALMTWIVKQLTPQIRALISHQAQLAEQRATYPLQKRIRELETELATFRRKIGPRNWLVLRQLVTQNCTVVRCVEIAETRQSTNQIVFRLRCLIYSSHDRC